MSDPRQSEAAGKSATFEFKGESFTIPLEWSDYSLAYIEAASDGAPLAIQARELLGREQWERVRAMNLTGRGLDELEAAITEASGIDAGNGPASGD